ncbi:uncharacterized protein BO97DRAFT_423647 [Aspergillus homomorphus CBS 101889]|uniref:Uncharacterized protein n=1 Tax=Aspergillus homomorphus (strain CBS 101889) TaxID=1450537 RepID=A0A395I4Z0_ASPHC|nr:hypothetical protein BO97DRAFT_423647 [Aspergillus homomorphus CBS 101889]RAL13444.1 hypothetical protein BO97DRAFT_423647 [Aspergillus homomorphus CBS 101889]
MDPNGGYSNKIPILMLMPNATCARELLLQGADPNCADRRGRTPLEFAVKSTWEPNSLHVEMLLAHGAKLEPDLLCAAAAPRVPQGEFMTRFLLEKGLEPNTASAKDGSILHYAVWSDPVQMARRIDCPELRQSILALFQIRGVDDGEDGVEGAD